ncbi:65-kDa microtubule-associated protein 8-like isoform X2 [Nymphaea colorata]|uniref:65-kDa microtubule-associated protein 8-like isoform X2 n=1 Tax=Nymphaea colorata TaxID=210225 RepID=UPI00129EEC7E|nr:65-kDa microtubule-associated protein 8-like isoform X2 [Nymphaea colorata]
MGNSTMIESSCGYLLQELKLVWDEVGQDQIEREKVLLELQQECLEIYRKKVENANISRARLLQQLADYEAEYANLLVVLGEETLATGPEKLVGTVKQQLDSIKPALRDMQKRRDDRRRQFLDVQSQIQMISAEIQGNTATSTLQESVDISQNDLSLKKLQEYTAELEQLQKEKNERLKRVEDYLKTVNSLCAALGMDSSKIIEDVDPSFNCSSESRSKSMTDDALHKLNNTVESLKEEKQKRLEKLQNLGKTLRSMWDLMDTSSEEQQLFANVTETLVLSPPDTSNPGSLTLEEIDKAEAEVQRLNQLKFIKMKDLFQGKRMELEEICKKSHMDLTFLSETDYLVDLISTGDIDHVHVLSSMEGQITKAREEAYSRKVILDKVERWTAACEEERWLEEYNKDENRYSASRGAHKNLQRALRARNVVHKIPALVQQLITKTKKWENERNKIFFYEDVPLLALLDEYNTLRQEKAGEQHRQKERKNVQNHVFANQENLSILHPSTSSGQVSTRYYSTSFGSTMPVHRYHGKNSAAQDLFFIKEGSKLQGQKIQMQRSYISQLGDDSSSQISATFSGPTCS